MKEFLDNLYKQCALNSHGTDELFWVIPKLAYEKKFIAINSIISDVDLSKLDNATLYSLVLLTSTYINFLSNYKVFYTKTRQEFARRGEKDERISKLLDQFENGSPVPYDPNAKTYLPKKDDIDDKINYAKSINDKELETYLQIYKSQSLNRDKLEYDFLQLRKNIGDDELRKRTITSLREMANLLESTTGCWPGIYYAKLPKDLSLKDNIIDSIEVTLSYPWPG